MCERARLALLCVGLCSFGALGFGAPLDAEAVCDESISGAEEVSDPEVLATAPYTIVRTWEAGHPSLYKARDDWRGESFVDFGGAPAPALAVCVHHGVERMGAYIKSIFKAATDSSGQPLIAYRWLWRVNVVRLADGRVLARKSFAGGPPAESIHPGGGGYQNYGSIPSAAFNEWIRSFRRTFDLYPCPSPVKGVRASFDGSRLAAIFESGVDVIDSQSRKRVVRITHPAGFEDADISPEGRSIATVSQDGIVRIWDAATGALMRSLQGGKADAYPKLRISPNGALLAVKESDVVRLWSLTSGESLAALPHPISVDIAFSPGSDLLAVLGKTLANPSRVEVKLWDTSTFENRKVKTLKERNWGMRMAFTADGRLLISGSTEGGSTAALHILDVADENEERTLQYEWSGNLDTLAPLADGSIAVAGPGPILIWDLSEGRVVKRLVGCRGAIAGIVALPDGRFVSGADDGLGLIRVPKVSGFFPGFLGVPPPFPRRLS